MELSQEELGRIAEDLGLNQTFLKGKDKPVRNCWHFSSDGSAIDFMFYDENDFRDGMNRIYVVVREYSVIILAFSLMDTHVHFVLYGDFDECNRFVHDYLKRTSRHISLAHGDKKKLLAVPVSHQKVDTDSYLKTVISYTIKNAPVGGIPFSGCDYPWSSGPLYFRRSGYWSSPRWMTEATVQTMGRRERQRVLKAHQDSSDLVRMIDGLVFPGEYVAFEVVEMLFRTQRAFHFFLCRSREEDVDARGGAISHLSIPIQEMRQHRTELCRELFQAKGVGSLDSAQRLRLARILKSRYNSSLKQIARLSGLVYDEVKDIL